VAVIKKPYSLNQKQLHILMLIYKFRFITIPLLTNYKNLKSNSLQRNLDILLKEKYVYKRFNLTYKIDRKPAIYWLTAKGVAVFKDDPRFNPSVLHSYYKNKSLSDEFIQHNLDTFTVYNAIKNTHKDKFEMFTKQEITHFTDFPEAKPDIYLRGPKEYFIVLAHDMQTFILKKRLKEYIVHSEEIGWGSGNYPTLLFILKTHANETRFLYFAGNLLDGAGIDPDELPIAVTTLKAISQTAHISEIWTFAGEDAVPRHLD
jgi:DNA-binding MarR family transcriptional regulator